MTLKNLTYSQIFSLVQMNKFLIGSGLSYNANVHKSVIFTETLNNNSHTHSKRPKCHDRCDGIVMAVSCRSYADPSNKVLPDRAVEFYCHVFILYNNYCVV
ncbi:hypothetical protein FQN60_008489 [Etheostoma spectabile]|uniref:Uncharacterized protein n=1 Tax=Etheostoma spectabile TaxID=54343 RepID=A0A5J5CU24_9PERO|nr:hypothetical protein FQN60_008489 [Etheostoma spectabile]